MAVKKTLTPLINNVHKDPYQGIGSVHTAMYFLRGRTKKAGASGKPATPVEVRPIRCPQTFDFQGLLAGAYELEEFTFVESDDAEGGLGGSEKAGEVGAGEGMERIPLGRPADVGKKAGETGMGEDGTGEGKGLALKRTYAGAFPENKATSASHRRRREKRNKQIMMEGHLPNAKALTSVLQAGIPVSTDLKTLDLPVTSCGFQALHHRQEDERVAEEKLKDMLSKGYTLIPSDPGVPRPFLDSAERVVGAFCGRPDDAEYLEACSRVYKLFEEVGGDPALMDEAVKNRRGSFPVINIGITHGKGTAHPVNLHEGKDKPSKHEGPVGKILQDADLNRIATFQSSCFKIWSPNVYESYRENLNTLYRKRPNLKRNFVKSVFPCCAVNCGPKAWTRRHRDSMNLPYGMCAITALGAFDHRTGGHLVLPDLRLIVEFPVGSVILIPSATLVHANIGVLDQEVRASFTQFAAGGLFRYIENDFMTEKALKAKDKVKFAEVCARKKLRWVKGLRQLSYLSDLVDFQEEQSCV